LLQTEWRGLSIRHSREACKNRWTDRDAFWVVGSGALKEPYAAAMRPYAKLLWPLVTITTTSVVQIESVQCVCVCVSVCAKTSIWSTCQWRLHNALTNGVPLPTCICRRHEKKRWEITIATLHKFNRG